MRGMIFTELFELVEKKFGYDFLDDVIDDSKLPNDGAYAATGNYSFDELLRIVVSISQRSNIPVPALLEVFGENLFEKLILIFSNFDKEMSILDFIENVETYIHVEVKKLYPDVELPTFEIVSKTEEVLEFDYISKKKLHHLAKGLIIGASKYLQQNVEVDLIENEVSVRIIVRKI